MLVSTQGNEREVGALNRLKDTVRSAATVLSAASTTVDVDDVPTNNVHSNASVSPWEPDETFYQWMATVADFTTVKPVHVEIRPGVDMQYPNNTASTDVSLTQTQGSNLKSPSGPPSGPTRTMAVSGDWPAVPAITMMPASDMQQADRVSQGYTLPTEQEQVSPLPPGQDEDLFRAVTVLPDQSDQGVLGLKLSSHTRSSSAPSNLLSTLSLGSPKSEKNRFWKLSRPRSQVNVAEPQTGLKVHEPKSSASLSATNIASEEHDAFNLVELYSQARCSMDMGKIPTPTKKGGKTCVKAVYVGDGACGKTCSLM